VKRLALLLLALGGAAWAGEATGKLAGVLSPAGKATKVGAVERIPATLMKLHDKPHWGTLDPKTGAFTIDNLAPGKYDLAIEMPEGKIEGVELHVLSEENEPTYDLNLVTGELKVQRFDITPFVEEHQVLSPEERDKLIRKKLRIDALIDRVQKTLTVARFMDANRPLYAHGTPKRAIVLMELARKDAFYAEAGDQVIWRVETWPFLWMSDVWHKPNKGLRVWQRMRIPAADFAKMGYVYDPTLGGIEVKAGETAKVDYTLPESLAKGLGKAPQ